MHALHRQRYWKLRRLREAEGEIFAEIPRHKPAYAVFDGDVRAVPRNFFQPVNAGLSFVDVARLHGHQANVRRFAQAGLDSANQLTQFNRLLIPDIA
jgi:hypothetical protein